MQHRLPDGEDGKEAGRDGLKAFKALSSSKRASGFDLKIKQEFKRAHLNLQNSVLQSAIFNVKLQCTITLKE